MVSGAPQWQYMEEQEAETAARPQMGNGPLAWLCFAIMRTLDSSRGRIPNDKEGMGRKGQSLQIPPLCTCWPRRSPKESSGCRYQGADCMLCPRALQWMVTGVGAALKYQGHGHLRTRKKRIQLWSRKKSRCLCQALHSSRSPGGKLSPSQAHARI